MGIFGTRLRDMRTKHKIGFKFDRIAGQVIFDQLITKIYPPSKGRREKNLRRPRFSNDNGE